MTLALILWCFFSKASEEELEAAVEAALEAGYRHIDTAAAYANESVIGNVLKRWLDEEKVTRDELFIVTKVWTEVRCHTTCTHLLDGPWVKYLRALIYFLAFLGRSLKSIFMRIGILKCHADSKTETLTHKLNLAYQDGKRQRVEKLE